MKQLIWLLTNCCKLLAFLAFTLLKTTRLFRNTCSDQILFYKIQQISPHGPLAVPSVHAENKAQCSYAALALIIRNKVGQIHQTAARLSCINDTRKVSNALTRFSKCPWSGELFIRNPARSCYQQLPKLNSVVSCQFQKFFLNLGKLLGNKLHLDVWVSNQLTEIHLLVWSNSKICAINSIPPPWIQKILTKASGEETKWSVS